MGQTLFVSDSSPMLEAIAAFFGDEIEHDGGATAERAYLFISPRLLELPQPEEIHGRWAKPWTFEALPIVPRALHPDVVDNQRRALDAALDRILSDEVDRVVLATRPGPDSALLASDLLNLIPDDLELYRLWPASLHARDVRHALAHSHAEAIFAKRLARWRGWREYTWIVRHNLSRLCSVASDDLMPITAMGTPLLGLCEQQEQAAAGPHAGVMVSFYEGALFRAQLVDIRDKEVVMQSTEEVERVLSSCYRHPFKVHEVEEIVEPDEAPRFFDLAALQKASSRQLDLDPRRTTCAALELFEAGLITWPGTSCRGLLKGRIEHIPETLMAVHVLAVDEVDHLMEEGGARTRAEGFVTTLQAGGHEAILPTPKSASLESLGDDAVAVYRLIARRFVAALMPPGQMLRTRVVLHCGGYRFLAKASTILEPGWRLFDEEKVTQRARITLKRGEQIVPMDINVTKPEPVTEAALIDALERHGFGTPVARGDALAWLVMHGFVRREQGGQLRTSEKGRRVLERLRGYAARSEGLRVFLDLEAAAELSRRYADLYAAGQGRVARDHLAKLLTSTRDGVLDAISLGHACPECGGRIRITEKGYVCENWKRGRKDACPVSIWGQIMDQDVPAEMMDEILANGVSESKMSFVSKRTGNPYDARLALDREVWRVSLCFEKRAK